MKTSNIVKLKGTKTRNGSGFVKVKTCFCGKKYIVRRGKNRDGIPTVFDPKQCGKHASLRKPKTKQGYDFYG